MSISDQIVLKYKDSIKEIIEEVSIMLRTLIIKRMGISIRLM
jgi:hypothetical protein